ncbi:ras and Rab interactor 2 [Chanos chanos]|uniref:Ras and Rab interactor 2 n=1 Tax=Chanos chanos TaxID=29144 RepID=A0A6J2W0W4_CHACN|nr:ras and Rab interactor 2-like [Chanos chanos]
MAMNTALQPSRRNRSGSFFKLIDAFASELGALEQEMAQTVQPKDRDSDLTPLPCMEGEVSGVYLQSPASNGPAGGGERDCGYDSLRRRMSVLDRLTLTHPVWLLLSINDQEATRILLQQPPGVFMVRRSSTLQGKVLSVRLDETSVSPILNFPVKEGLYTFSLDGSGISFADLFRLAAFYCISRDVLPFTLKLPEAIASAKTQTELEDVAQLGAGFWDSALASQRRSPLPQSRPPIRDKPLSLQRREPPATRQGQGRILTRQERDPPPAFPSCSAPPRPERGQTNRALCFVNPLFHQTHQRVQGATPEPHSKGGVEGTGSRSHVPPPRPPPPRSLPRRPAVPQGQRSMPVTVSWSKQQQHREQNRLMGAKVSSTRKPPPPRPKKQPDMDSQRCTIALDDETIARALSRANLPHKTLPRPEQNPRPWGGTGDPGERLSDMSLSTSTSSDSLDSPHPPPPPLGLPPSPVHVEDSSDEEEEEEEEDYGVGLESDLQLRLRASRHSKRFPPGGPASLLILPRALKGKFQKVSGVFSSLMTPERRAVRRICELARDKGSYFGCLVQDYMSFVQENHQNHSSGFDLLQTLRQFLTQMKAYLLQCSELNPPIESLIPEYQIDQVLERAMHKCVLKPLKGAVDSALHDFQVRSGEWQQLKENLALVKAKRPAELGVEGTSPPDPMAIERIRHKFHKMRKMYSPEKKVTILLRVCKLIYTIMQEHSGRMFGADDFLPMLTYVLAQCDMPHLDSEILYMMELLDPSLLHGEGGYYLTSAYGAMSLVKNFQEEQAARVLSSEARNTLHQWHQRRTAQRTIPTVDDLQNYLRVALQEPGSGCTAKTMLVRPYATTEEVCRLCALKFQVPDPENHALFLLTGETSQQLALDTHPQRIKAEIHSRPHPLPFHFVYRRVPDPNAGSPTRCQNGHCPPD